MNSSIPTISIIIPCYNDGVFLVEAVESVKQYPVKEFYEIIIIDDGSKDQKTLSNLKLLEKQGCQVIHKKNGGPASARNVGVKIARGKYILPLDSDNKIEIAYIEKAIAILEKKEVVGVVYAKPSFFGEDLSIWKVREFDLETLFIDNYIDTCAIYKKVVWESVEGYDESRQILGWEDWDFWMRVALQDWEFHFIDEELFYYRLRKDSLIHHYSKEEMERMSNYLFSKPEYKIVKLYREKALKLKRYNSSLPLLGRTFFKVLQEKINRRIFNP